MAGGPGEGFDNDNHFDWGNNTLSPAGPLANKRPRYSDAYGDYMGGYSPGGRFDPEPSMPAGPHGISRGSTWAHGNGPELSIRKNYVDDKTIKYLISCGVTKNLLNLPHSLLTLYRPEHCHLCDMVLLSYKNSKAHYISRNHLKNQKKWMIRTQGSTSAIEMPFKSRDLYCELCDVEITSKTHGEAHYGGKLHRGIVEGRKKPKNPMLLQYGMHQRVEGLLKREKRFLTPAIQAASSQEKADKIEKNMSSELYCDVCKTTVTCTEQMIMHRNGKRHLAKEKQHIFKTIGNEKKNKECEEKKEDEEKNKVEEVEAQPEYEKKNKDCEEKKEDEEKNKVEEVEAQPEWKIKPEDDDIWGDETRDSEDQLHTTAEDWM